LRGSRSAAELLLDATTSLESATGTSRNAAQIGNVDVDVDMNLNVNATLDLDVDVIRSSS
jgi:hypothetical protein